jgi:hypothetical protein
MNSDTHQNMNQELNPVIDIRKKKETLPILNNSSGGYRHFISSYTQLIGYEGYGYNLENQIGKKLETLSLRNGRDLIRSSAQIISIIPKKQKPTYLITISNGVVIKASHSQQILSATNQPIPVAELEVGDVITSGNLRYEHSILYPSLSLGLNYIIDKQKVLSPPSHTYEIEINGYDNLLIGQEMDGETSVLCLTTDTRKVA